MPSARRLAMGAIPYTKINSAVWPECTVFVEFYVHTLSCSETRHFSTLGARHRACERSVYRAGVRGNLWTVSTRSRRVLRKQLEAYEARGLAVTSIRVRGGGRIDVDAFKVAR